MKVLLVYPEFPDTYWSFRHALAFEGKRSTFPPLGLLTVSAMLPNTWERRLVDTNVQPLRSSDIEWADIVFTSAMIAQKASLREVVALSKTHGTRVVVGRAVHHHKHDERIRSRSPLRRRGRRDTACVCA